jgi:hypothetical protein
LKEKNIVLLHADESPSVCFIERTECHKKLKTIFDDDQNFDKIKKINLEEELESCKKLLRETILENLSSNTLKKWVRTNRPRFLLDYVFDSKMRALLLVSK